MMSHEVAKLINEQINKEFYSAYLYLDMANFYGERDLDGFANYFHIQAMEERDHAMKFLDYLAENNEAISLEAIAKPEADRSSLMAPLVQALKHEEFVTASIHNIYSAAIEAADYRSQRFLGWFIDEQGEEEASARALIARMELFGDENAKGGLYLLNQELAARSYSPAE